MAGYSKTPLAGKLGLKAGMRAAFVNAPDSVLSILQPLPDGVIVLKRPGREMDYVHFFAESERELAAAFVGLKASLAKTGMLWVSWRKGKKGTDVTETQVRAVALGGGLVDVKVCAVDEVWSGLKLVYRLKDRQPFASPTEVAPPEHEPRHS
jgi:hypothetical protein